MTPPPSTDPQADRTLEDVFEQLPPLERERAEERFKRYVDLALRIYSRLESDPDAHAQFKALTDEVYRPTITKERPTSPAMTTLP